MSRDGDFLYELVTPAQPAIPEIPAQRLLLAAANWDAGAVSIPIIEKNGGYRWRVRSDTVGAVVGLAANYAGSGYRTIDHGLIFRRGQVHVFNRGVQGAHLGGHASSDVFIIGRAGAQILVFKNDVVIYSEPARINGVFRLAATIYLSENSVNDAAVVPLETFITGSGEGLLPRVEGLALDETNGVASGVIAPMVGSAGSINVARGDGTLPNVQGIASSAFYGAGDGVLPALEGQASSGDLVLSVNFADGMLPHVEGYARGHIGASAVGNGSLPPMEGLASDRFVGMASGVLPLVRSYSGTFQVLTGGAFVYRSYGLVAAGRTTQVQGFAARISGVTLRAFGGATARVKLPPLKISASGIFEAVARAAIRLPKLRLAARGTVPYLAQARFKFASYDVVARTGAVAKLKFSGFSMAARGSAGSVGAAHLRYGTFKLLARATQENVARGVMLLPKVTMRTPSVAIMVLPRYYLRASIVPMVGAERNTYAINVSTGAVTRYPEFPFDNVLRFGDRFFGVRSDGIYELTGDTDNGDPILAQVRTFDADFGQTNVKRVLYVHVVGDIGSDIQVGLTPDAGTEYVYPTELVPVPGVQTSRAVAGRGMRGIYYSVAWTNSGGQPFEIHRLEALTDTTSRLK